GSCNNVNQVLHITDWIPPYQSLDAWSWTRSYTTDDYIEILDDDEGDEPNDLIDMGVGRLPVSSLQQAKAVVDKLLGYDKLELLSAAGTTCDAAGDGGGADWRNLVLFCSDDQHGSRFEGDIHMANSAQLARRVEHEEPCLNVNKI